MNLIIFLMMVVLFNSEIGYVTAASFLLKLDVSQKNYQNDILNSEIIIEGPEVKDIYLIEQEDQNKRLEEAMQKKEKLEKKYKKSKSFSVSNLTPAGLLKKGIGIARSKSNLSSASEEINRLKNEMNENKFCLQTSPAVDVCKEAFTNSFFMQKKWNYSKQSEKTCYKKQIHVSKDEKNFVDEKLLVKCEANKVDQDKRDTFDIYLLPSVRYVPGKNLKFFVLQGNSTDPVAYLMNTKKNKKSNVAEASDNGKPVPNEKLAIEN